MENDLKQAILGITVIAFSWRAPSAYIPGVPLSYIPSGSDFIAQDFEVLVVLIAIASCQTVP